MNFSVHIDDDTLAALGAAVERTGLTRNRIIVTAIQEWLQRNAEKDWPEALRAHFANPAPERIEDALDLEGWRQMAGSSVPRSPW